MTMREAKDVCADKILSAIEELEEAIDCEVVDIAISTYRTIGFNSETKRNIIITID